MAFIEVPGIGHGDLVVTTKKLGVFNGIFTIGHEFKVIGIGTNNGMTFYEVEDSEGRRVCCTREGLALASAWKKVDENVQTSDSDVLEQHQSLIAALTDSVSKLQKQLDRMVTISERHTSLIDSLIAIVQKVIDPNFKKDDVIH